MLTKVLEIIDPTDSNLEDAAEPAVTGWIALDELGRFVGEHLYADSIVYSLQHRAHTVWRSNLEEWPYSIVPDHDLSDREILAVILEAEQRPLERGGLWSKGYGTADLRSVEPEEVERGPEPPNSIEAELGLRPPPHVA